jgi:uncharacterized protein (DUF2267 family)
VEYEAFIDAVAERADLPWPAAEQLTHAALRVLAERISGGEAEDLAAQLPRDLKADLEPPQEDAQSFGASEFARRMAERTGLAETEAEAALIAVLTTLREAVTPGEFDDVLSQLGEEFAALVV